MSDLLVSPATAITILVGVAISIVYLIGMGKALKKAADTIDVPEPEGVDAYAFSFAGAVIAVLASSAAIMSYGLSPSLLYVGVGLALLSPIAVAYALFRELRD